MSLRPGFLIIDKPTGATSFSMVSLVRRLAGVRRVGHAGTLDPLASGVLPIAVGAATRLIEYLDDAPKTYAAVVRLGAATTTFDAEGEVTEARDASGIGRHEIEAALGEFVGEIEQVPPRYSALKVAGKPMYAYAREGTDVAPAARRVRIDSIRVLGYANPDLEFEVVCGKGTYIRSLAHDLGARLGCGAHLAALRRTASGGFTLEDTHAPDDLISAQARGEFEELLLAPDRAVERRPAAIFASAPTAAIVAGRDVSLPSDSRANVCRAYSVSGEFLGVLAPLGSGRWHPEKVLLPSQKG
jgi:tRNA pseudouridine55 synthase